jgi:hypothetical protein
VNPRTNVGNGSTQRSIAREAIRIEPIAGNRLDHIPIPVVNRLRPTENGIDANAPDPLLTSMRNGALVL